MRFSLRSRSSPPVTESLPGFISHSGSRSTLRELWHARHLVSQLICRDLTVRYRQTWLGWLWALLSPMANLAMYYVVFGVMVRFSPPDTKVPYALVLMSGLVLWMLFQSTVNAVSECLLNNLQLIKKVWFPRTALTLASVGVSLADFALACLLLLLMVSVNDCPLTLTAIPILLICALLTALAGWGLGCMLAVARLRFRDVRHMTPLLMQGLFYATPVVWTPGLLPAHLQGLAAINPLYGLVGLFRYAVTAGPLPATGLLIQAIASCLLLAVVGYYLFVRYEAQVMDRE